MEALFFILAAVCFIGFLILAFYCMDKLDNGYLTFVSVILAVGLGTGFLVEGIFQAENSWAARCRDAGHVVMSDACVSPGSRVYSNYDK